MQDLHSSKEVFCEEAEKDPCDAYLKDAYLKIDEFKELMETECRNMITSLSEVPSSRSITIRDWDKWYDRYCQKSKNPLGKVEFFKQLEAIIDEYKENLQLLASSCDKATPGLEDAIYEAQNIERLNELLKNETVEDYKHLTACPDRERDYKLLRGWEKRIDSLAEAYWCDVINRDELVERIKLWNRRKYDDQREIKIGYILSNISANYDYFERSRSPWR